VYARMHACQVSPRGHKHFGTLQGDKKKGKRNRDKLIRKTRGAAVSLFGR
jgi:hypothetical protein